jgi:hypothetical protein
MYFSLQKQRCALEILNKRFNKRRILFFIFITHNKIKSYIIYRLFIHGSIIIYSIMFQIVLALINMADEHHSKI